MSKSVKVPLVLFVFLMLILGMGYGLARVEVIPVKKLAAHKPALQFALRLVGLYPPVKAGMKQTLGLQAPDPLAGEKQAIRAEREAFDKERASYEAQKQSQARTEQQAQAAAVNALPDPKEMARLATIYEQMPAETVNKIFLKLPENEALSLLRRMDEKQVALLLGGMPPERAARLTQFLSRPAPNTPQQAAAVSP